VTALHIVGPESIAPNAFAQFKATADRANGTSEDVTSTATWSSTQSGVLQSRKLGQMRGEHRGEAIVRATFEGVTGELTVFVLEPGTFAVRGTITDGTTGQGPLGHASIMVMSGTGAGLWSATDATGRYGLYGVAGPIELVATADGLTPQVHQIVVSGRSTENFVLTTAPPEVINLSGAWTISFSAASSCQNQIPVSARDRQYESTITQQGAVARLVVKSDAVTDFRTETTGSFVVDGVVSDQTVVFDFPPVDDYYPAFWEKLNSEEWVGLGGIVRLGTATSEMRGTLSGEMDWSDPANALTCRAGDHTVTLRKK
jgi:hypothetical protein